MLIRVRLFASYREAAGTGSLELELPPGASVADALRALGARVPRLGNAPGRLVARNLGYVDPDAPLAEGDELAVIPPVSGGSGATDERILISDRPLSLDAAIEAVRDDAYGALVVFAGTVRGTSRGQTVTRLDYEAYPEMATTTMRAIAERLEGEHGVRLALHHRVGELGLGEIAVLVVAGAPHREAAFAAARAAIDELKRVVPIWKKEHTSDGAIWIEDHA